VPYFVPALNQKPSLMVSIAIPIGRVLDAVFETMDGHQIDDPYRRDGEIPSRSRGAMACLLSSAE